MFHLNHKQSAMVDGHNEKTITNFIQIYKDKTIIYFTEEDEPAGDKGAIISTFYTFSSQ